MRSGRYQAESGQITFDIRAEIRGGALILSGDILAQDQFVAGFRGEAARPETPTSFVQAPLSFIGHPRLDTGSLRIDVDDRGIGSFQLTVDLQGSLRDTIAGEIRWISSRYRMLSIEIDGLEGTDVRTSFTARNGEVVSLASAYEAVGFDVDIRQDRFGWIAPRAQETRGWTPAEMHRAMEQIRTGPRPGTLQTHVFVCGFMAGPRNRGVLGIMYDWRDADENDRAREGVAIFHDHPLLSDPRVPVAARDREFTYTLIHEVGHALNMLHSFDKTRPAAMSFMNYPDLFPFGHEAPEDHDGSNEFWSQFEHVFDDQELDHLRHGTRREIFPGGFEFGRYEDGLSTPFGGQANPRRPAPGLNPLRTTHDLSLTLDPLKSTYELGEPVFTRIALKNVGREIRAVPTKLDPIEGFLQIEITEPDGRTFDFRPPMRLCAKAERTALLPGEELTGHPGAPLFISADGPIFTKPGRYVLRGRLAGVDGFQVAESAPVSLTVDTPTRAIENFAETVWDTPGSLRALYLRHPLADLDAWHVLDDAAERAKLRGRRGNSTADHIDYVRALGWLSPFADLKGRQEAPADVSRAREIMRELRTDDLPHSYAERQNALETLIGTKDSKKYFPAETVSTPPVAVDPIDVQVPPAGLFGSAGLDLPGVVGPLIDPFVRVVDTFRGTRRFADLVTWNIQQLHSERRSSRFRRVARLIRDMRCDFWALQEVDIDALKRVVYELNSMSSIHYTFQGVHGRGQQCGCIYRTDTTTVQPVRVRRGLFSGEIEVELRDGRRKTKDIFLRDPHVTEVRIRNGQQAFDFRCANVHLKATDSDYKDKGNAHRLAAAERLAQWISEDRGATSEIDYFIFGDLNGEKASQGLGPFLDHGALDVLSVGMQDKYGEDNSLTRVASKRTLDHIIVTSDTTALAPTSDLGEQIVIRTDRRIPNFTRSHSDHIPVAARFIISEDHD
ncbi:endonuclease/exonuclease/phosphatase family protein [Pelagibius sp.]|uniref:endonuclease/exonuclease/phosphatase family protein n=1 Tax=Pelagibius sp. TaxID=1931238 RepID=UPI003B510184